MIRHIVLLRFPPDLRAGVFEDLMGHLSALRGHLPGILDFQSGVNVSPETAVEHGNGHGFWVDFEDAAARDAYLEDPAHQAIGAKLVHACQGGIEGITVFDMEL